MLAPRIRSALGIFARGLLMGSADVVPGVSGGTVALITGIYARLLNGIRSIGPATVRELLRFRFRKASETVDWMLFVPLAAGIGTAIVSLAGIITWLLETYPSQIKSLFIGMIAGSALVVGRKLHWSPWMVLMLAGGIGLGFGVEYAIPTDVAPSLPYLFLCGCISVCAMLLPGISGAYILLLLGQYEEILTAIHAPLATGPDGRLHLLVLIVFGLGCLTGLATFSRILGRLISRWEDFTLAALVGLMLGSLRKLWVGPAVSASTSPAGFAASIAVSAGFIVTGFLIVLVVHKKAVGHTPPQAQTSATPPA